MTLKKTSNEMEEFKKFIASEFYEREFKGQSFSSSQQFLTHLRAHSKYPNFKKYIDLIEPDSMEDKYGVITLKSTKLNVEFQLKRQDCYSGPKTQDYLLRVDLRINAAIKWISHHPQLVDNAQEKRIELEKMRIHFKEQIQKNCAIDHTLLKNQNYKDPKFVEHFNEQHAKAQQNFAALLAVMEKTLDYKGKKPKHMQESLYIIERDLMSKKRVEQTTFHSLKFEEKEYLEICTSTPVDKEKTVSSAKKDEAGVANWVKTNTQIFDIQSEPSKPFQLSLLENIDNYRSASIVPHEILLKKGFFNKVFGKGGLNKALAIETAKRNVEEHIIPQLINNKKTSSAHHSKGVIELNYEMLTLISPISKYLDKLVDPDATQFKAIRQAMNHYNGRTVNVLIQGEQKNVKFNTIYHNYGVNPGRGFPLERATNMKAYNEVIDRSISKIEKISNHELKSFIGEIPRFTKSQDKKMQVYQLRLEDYYRKMDKHPLKLSKKNHESLMLLNTKKVDKTPFSHQEKILYESLVNQFNSYHRNINSLENKAKRLEKKKRSIHGALAKRRKNYFNKNHLIIDKKLNFLESQSLDPVLREQVAHLRTLVEFTQLSKMAYDSLTRRIFMPSDVEKNNNRNYEIQTYIQRLSEHCNWNFHKTCKSGKDRTNVAEEKFKAKKIAALSLGRFPKFKDDLSVLKNIRAVFECGFNQGPGNRLCGFNMPPGAQQISAFDVPTNTANPSIIRKMSLLQKFKGIDKIKINKKQLMKVKNEIKAVDFEQHQIHPTRNAKIIAPQEQKRVSMLAQKGVNDLKSKSASSQSSGAYLDKQLRQKTTSHFSKNKKSKPT